MRILAIDGNSIMNRAFYGIKLLTNKKGVPTNAILGFMKILIRAIEDLRPDSVVVAFDLHAPTFRHKAVETYKANRKGMPPELQEQMPIIKDLLRALGYKILEIEGYEADDILGTISKICTENNTDCIILTGDRDNLQLIGENVSVRLATTKENIFFDTQKFREEYGFEPINLIDLKALMGDSSDNISGVPGIGEKTATALILDFATVENLYENLDKAKISAGMKAKLESGKSLAEQSKWLATIVKNVPIDTEISAYQNSPPDEASAAKILTELGMFNLLEKLNFKASIEVFAEENPAKIEKKNVEIAFENFTDSTISSLKQADFILTENLLKIQDNGKVYEIADEENILKFLTSDCKKRTSTAKNAYEFAQSHKKCLVNVVLDAEIADYLISSTPSNGSVERLCGEYGVPFQDFAENSEIANLSPLCDILEEKIDAARMKNLLMEIEQPLTEVLASMEVVGVKINADGVRNFGEILKSDLHKLEEEIYNLAGSNFNISSPKQLGVVLFEQLGLPCKKKTKTGYSTNVDVLESLREKHPIIEPILKYRQLSKLNSTYVEGLLKVVGADGRIHSNFKQTETRTGRISSTEPNVQNIPVRTELGSNMRKFFVSDDGKVLLDADYSQIELRILASICGDKTMQSAFSTGIDIHTLTAAQVFGVPTDMVT
ncbi:MAG: DNA polymerase I, partial [Oscillospiraceae bacterium]